MKNHSVFQGIIELHGEKTVRLQFMGTNPCSTGKLYRLERLQDGTWLYEGSFFSSSRTNKALYQDALNFLDYDNALNPRF